jgi:ATP-dependent DNA helicase RecQ
MAEQSTAQDILQSVFGYGAFRGRQADIIADVLRGDHVLAVMPTGAGKSLCFQIPALMREKVTIVVSPLISLMQNQVDALRLLGVPAASLNSTNTPEDNQAIWQSLQDGSLRLLYVSPEKLMTERMLAALEQLGVGGFAIDEAHCISQWGAAFRPEYEMLSALQHRFPGVPIIALTATADEATRKDIADKIFSGNVTTYLTGFDRPNIRLDVTVKKGWKQQLLSFLNGRREGDKPAEENGIVYCLSRRKTEEAAALLAEKGYNACAYHAGMPGDAREAVLRRFMAEPDLIVVATIAFGMGIDKPDIRFVFHTDLPASPEAYYQEIGRAGRDGEPAVAHMLYGMDDIRMRRLFIDGEEADEAHKRRSHQRLNVLLGYCEAPTCRRHALLTYFGETPGAEGCGNCDVCEMPRETREATEAAQMLLSAVYRTRQTFGLGHIIDILTGRATDRVEKLGHAALPTFGVGAAIKPPEWKTIARQMMARGLVMADMEHGSLKIPQAGIALLKGEGSFAYCPDPVQRGTSAGSSRASVALPTEAQDLFQMLKALRREIAEERSVPAYIVFSDKTLVDMAMKRPTSLRAFGDVYGVGAGKQREFGERFVACIAAHR